MEDYERSKAQQEAIAKRIEDLVALDANGTAISLIPVALGILAKHYPPDLDDDARHCIRDNYPDATDALIAERAMSQEGVTLAIVAGTEMARIALDYSPLSHTKPEMDRDFQLPGETMRPITQMLVNAFDSAEEAGMSSFGVATTMILLAVVKAKEKGVVGLKLIRPLLDAISKAIDGPMKPLSEKEVEEVAIAALCEQMGISRTTAKKYVAMAKKANPGN